MRDQRAEALAQILVRYSTEVGPGDVCVIQGEITAEALALAVYEEVLRARDLRRGGRMTVDGAELQVDGKFVI